jgi:hypothetical protein
VPIPDPLDPDNVLCVLVAHGGPPIPTFADFERLFDARAKGCVAVVHEVSDITSTWTVSSEEAWFAALSRFDREYLAFAVRFAPVTLGFSRKPFFRMLMHASIVDGSIDLDDDETIVRKWNTLTSFEERIGCVLRDLPSLADLDPTLLQMAEHCIQVSGAFKEKLTSEWSIESIESGLKNVASRGPAGRVIATAQLTHARKFQSRLQVETVDYFASLAEEACLRLSKEARVLAFQDHPKRGPAATLRGLQNALFTRLVQDLMTRGLSRNKAVPTALELLDHVVGEPYRGNDSSRFNRRNQIRWASELGPSPQ